jgi:hypothetical protein
MQSTETEMQRESDYVPPAYQPDGEQLTPPCLHPTLDVNLGWYQLQNNVYMGGRYVFTPPGGKFSRSSWGSSEEPAKTRDPIYGGPVDSYLRQAEMENKDEFGERIANSFTLGYSREIIDIFVSTVFRQEVDRKSVGEKIESKYPGFMADVNLQGQSAREFLRHAFAIAQRNGWCGVLTDFPHVPEGTYVSQWHQQQDGKLRPFAQLVPPTRLWDWYRHPVTGDFLYAEIWQPDIKTEDNHSDTWKRWYPNSWEVVDRSGRVIDRGTHTFKRVPLDILICQDADADDDLAPFGRSRIAEACKIELEIYQMCSLLETHERKALFAFLHIPRDVPPEKGGKTAAPDLSLGPSHFIWSSEGAPTWVEPPSSVPEEARRQILWMIQEMRRTAGVSTRSEESTEAHSGVALSWEYSQRYNAIYESAQHLEDFESRWWRTVGEIAGVDVKPDAIRYPKEYAVHPVAQELDELDKLTKFAGEWPGMKDSMTPLIKRKLQRIAIADVGHLPEAGEVVASFEQYGKKTDGELPERTPMNGAQVTAVFAGIEGVAAGALPRDAVSSTLRVAFGLTEDEADKMLGSAGEGFVPTAQIAVSGGGDGDGDGEQAKDVTVEAEGTGDPQEVRAEIEDTNDDD